MCRRSIQRFFAIFIIITTLPAWAAQLAGEQSAVTWLASYTSESASNIEGGKRRGSAYAGQLFVGAEVDLNSVLHWQNTKMHVALTNRHGQNLAQSYIGNSTSVQEIYGGQNTRLARLTIEKNFLDGRLQWEAGRTVANISFLGSELCQYFQTNSACGNPTFVFRTSNFTWWPVSSWGTRAQYWMTPHLYVHAGIYEENTAHQDAGDHGFDWGIDESTGVVAPLTLGYKTTWKEARFPKRYELGGWYDSADYRDPLNDTDGNAAIVAQNPYAVKSGRSGIFARFEQVVIRSSLETKRSLTVFGAFLTGLSGELEQDYYIKAGVVKRGTFKGREKDSIGFVITRQEYADVALENQRLARAAKGGFGVPPSSQTMMELSYGIHVNDAVRVQPNIQYIVNPDQFAEPGRTEDLDNAWIIGLRLDVNLKQVAGFE